jgi:hypothetical protein
MTVIMKILKSEDSLKRNKKITSSVTDKRKLMAEKMEYQKTLSRMKNKTIG